jgi:hypothetical protein
MKRFAVGAILALLAAQSLRAADPPADQLPQYQAPWYKRWFGIGPEPPKPPPPPRRDPAGEAAAQRSAAEVDLNRRLKVCDELRRIALDTGNDQLDDRAMNLEQKAWELYKRQTAHLPCNRLVPSEEKLERQLGTPTSATAAAEKLAPSKTEAGRTSQANAFREVKP